MPVAQIKQIRNSNFDVSSDIDTNWGEVSHVGCLVYAFR
jgi:hypothetical protein